MAKIPKITPFYSSVTIPASYGNAISQQEALAYIQSIINVLILSNNEHEDTIQRLQAYVDKLDEEVKTTARQALNEWLADGTISQLIYDIINPMFNTLADELKNGLTKTDLYYSRIARQFKRFKNLPSAVLDNSSYHPNWLQGSTVFYKDGSLAMIGTYSDNSKVNPVATTYINTQQLIYYPQVEHSNTYIVSSNAYTVGHGNGMCYNANDDYFYIPFWTSYASGATVRTPDWHIARIKLNADGTDFVGYEVKEFTDFRTMDIGFYNGQMYAYDYDNNRIITFNWDGIISEICTITEPFMPATDTKYPLCFDVTKDMLFAVYQHQLVVYELSTGKILWCYSIPYLSNNGFSLGEIEGIRVLANGDLYILTNEYLGSKGQAQHTMQCIFKANFIKNTAIEHDNELTQFGALNAGRVIYVDGVFRANPSGYGVDGAFTYLQEAIDYIERSPHIEGANIYLMTDNNYYNSITGSKTINIVGVEASNPDTSHKTSHNIGGLYVRNGGHIHLDHIRVCCSNPNLSSAPIIILTGIVSTLDCSVGTTATATWFVATDYGVNMSSGIFSKYANDNMGLVHNTSGSLYFSGNQTDF